MKLTDDHVERLRVHIKRTFYYVESPEPVQEYWWKDREENLLHMSDMRLDHLKASANLIKHDIKQFSDRMTRDSNMEIYEKYLLKPARQKQRELEEVLKQRVLA